MTATATAAQIVPAERIRPGVAVQRVNHFDRDGRFLRQVRHYGTEEQARAWVELFSTHDTDPRHAELRAIVLGQK
ncbi:hypothetical protein [Microtetraspora niveoalba]|uniref:hypothetical protein n=1 Tax=Microtetraspora niveoalba TaxID=46175 RepID=UPI0008347F89|nr:hypothetical protein [Microtetraspora niveoalba]